VSAFPPLDRAVADRLLAVLLTSQGRGFIGPGDIGPHVVRSLEALPLIPAGVERALDLGSGGGVPGLPLALARPDIRWTLLDGSTTRGKFLEEAVLELGLGDVVDVVVARAEDAGRTDARSSFDVVVARSFGPPAATAECAAPFLRQGGRLVVAEPPGGDPGRWPAAALAPLGLVPGPRVTSPSAFQVLLQGEPCPARFPRRTGVPTKRPLF
jgi:16S rRNA (guanine527-N7)-methyltransferase